MPDLILLLQKNKLRARHNLSCQTPAAFLFRLHLRWSSSRNSQLWTHYADAGESSWHKRWISLNQSNLQIFKSDKSGTKPLLSFSLSSIVTKKLASSFERRHSLIVFTLLRNFIISFLSQPDLDSAVSLITRVQESASGSCPDPLLCACCPAHHCASRGGPVRSGVLHRGSCK